MISFCKNAENHEAAVLRGAAKTLGEGRIQQPNRPNPKAHARNPRGGLVSSWSPPVLMGEEFEALVRFLEGARSRAIDARFTLQP